MALGGEVVDKVFDVLRDVAVAPGSVGAMYPVLEHFDIPEWTVHMIVAVIFSAMVVSVREMRRNKHHHIHMPHLHHKVAIVPGAEARRVPPSKIRPVSIPA